MSGGGTRRYAGVDGDVPVCMMVRRSALTSSSSFGGLSKLQPTRINQQINPNLSSKHSVVFRSSVLPCDTGDMFSFCSSSTCKLSDSSSRLEDPAFNGSVAFAHVQGVQPVRQPSIDSKWPRSECPKKDTAGPTGGKKYLQGGPTAGRRDSIGGPTAGRVGEQPTEDTKRLLHDGIYLNSDSDSSSLVATGHLALRAIDVSASPNPSPSTTSCAAAAHVKVYLKNVMSLQTSSREEQLWAELQTIAWDILCLTETWRTEKEESWESLDGHLFCGSGGTLGERGVAILVHNSLKKHVQSFKSVNERLCVLDIRLMGKPMRILCAYMPHSGYADAVVEGMYSQMDSLIDEGRRCAKHVMICGDFNAVVGTACAGDDHDVIGPYGFGERNTRGRWLLEWASSHNLVLIDKTLTNEWTHAKDGRQ